MKNFEVFVFVFLCCQGFWKKDLGRDEDRWKRKKNIQIQKLFFWLNKAPRFTAHSQNLSVEWKAESVKELTATFSKRQQIFSLSSLQTLSKFIPHVNDNWRIGRLRFPLLFYHDIHEKVNSFFKKYIVFVDTMVFRCKKSTNSLILVTIHMRNQELVLGPKRKKEYFRWLIWIENFLLASWLDL